MRKQKLDTEHAFGVLKLRLIFFCSTRELYFADRVQNIFGIGLWWDTYEPLTFKLDMMTNTYEFYRLVLVLMTLVLTFIQDHSITRKLYCVIKLSVGPD